MTATLLANLDFILLVYGLGLVLLAVILLGLRSTITSPLPWKWLGLSAAFLGVNAWADMFALSVRDSPGVGAARTVLFVAGCTCLLEFDRSPLCKQPPVAAGRRRDENVRSIARNRSSVRTLPEQ